MEHACTIAIIISLIVLAYLIINYMSMATNIEGLETAAGETTGAVAPTAGTTPPIPNSASAANAYATSIAQQTQVIKDQLLMSQYTADYDNIIINLEEYINVKMVQIALYSNKSGSPTFLQQLGELKASKEALNDVMTYINTQTASTASKILS